MKMRIDVGMLRRLAQRALAMTIVFVVPSQIRAQEVDADTGLYVEYVTALQSADYSVDDLGVSIQFDGAGPANNIIVFRGGLGDELEVQRIVAWFDTRENSGPEGGEVIVIEPQPDGSIETPLQNPSVRDGSEYGLEDAVLYSGVWVRAQEAGQRIFPDALLFAAFTYDGEQYTIRNETLISYLDSHGVTELP